MTTKAELEERLAKAGRMLEAMQAERDKYKSMIAVFIKAGQDARRVPSHERALILLNAYSIAFKRED